MRPRSVHARASRFAIALLLAAPASASNLIVNGGFEAPATAQFTNIPAGSPDLPGWQVVSGSVDAVHSSLFPAFAGSQMLDLDGASPGTIEQTFTTSIGQRYTLTFAYSNNPQGGSNPARAHVTVSGVSAGDLVDTPIEHADATNANMNYIAFTGAFVANATSTTIRFASLNPPESVGGITLDEVAVLAACPGDANGDRVVDFTDLNIVLSFFGQSVTPGTSGDVNNDGAVNFADLNLVLSFFGTSC